MLYIICTYYMNAMSVQHNNVYIMPSYLIVFNEGDCN